jgi:stage IV sporulation protein FB
VGTMWKPVKAVEKEDSGAKDYEIVWPTGLVILRTFANHVLLVNESPNMPHFNRLTHVGRIDRVNVFVHWTVFAFAAVLLFGAIDNPVTTLVGIACWMGVLLLHECGHMVAAQRLGSRVYEIRLYPIFAVTLFETPWSRFDHTIIAWGGVIAQAIVAVPVLLWIKFLGYTPFNAANEVLTLFGFFSLAIAFFNLIPIRGLDGAIAWQIFPAFIERRRNLRKPQRAPGWRTYR